MPEWLQPVNRWFAEHHGIASHSTLLDLGMPSSTIQSQVRSGRLERVLPGVYRSPHWPVTPEQMLAAACASSEWVIGAFTTAGKCWRFRDVRENGRHLLVPHGHTPDIEGFTMHRCRRIDAVDVVERPDGIRLTSPVRTLFDSADMIGFHATRSVMEQILHEQLATFGTIADTLTRLYHPHRPGSRILYEVIGSRPKWQRALHSSLEERVLAEIERHHLPRPVSQCPVTLAPGEVIHVDFGWPDAKVGLEVDDPAWHTGVAERQRDAQRDRRAAVQGWIIVRVSRLDIDTGLQIAISEVASVLCSRLKAS